ncbi:MAG: peptidoglycan-binding domain-containing protein, partial [Gemmobacter sp.]
ALGLGQAERREIQGRLASLGHSPGGTDGAFGPRTRAAISAWQVTQGVVPTGYLNAAHLGALRQETLMAYPQWLAAQPAPTVRRNTGTTRTGARPARPDPCSVNRTDRLGRVRPECDVR